MIAGPMAKTDCSRVLRHKYPQPLQKRTAPIPIRRRVHTQDNMAALPLDISEGSQKQSEQCDAPTGNLLSLGLLKHPDRQPAAAGDRGLSQQL